MPNSSTIAVAFEPSEIMCDFFINIGEEEPIRVIFGTYGEDYFVCAPEMQIACVIDRRYSMYYKADAMHKAGFDLEDAEQIAYMFPKILEKAKDGNR